MKLKIFLVTKLDIIVIMIWRGSILMIVSVTINLKLTDEKIFIKKGIFISRKSKNIELVPRKLPLLKCLECITFKMIERLFPWWSEEPKFLAKKIKRLVHIKHL